MNTVYVNHPWLLEHHLEEITDSENQELIDLCIKADDINRPNLNKFAYNVGVPSVEVTKKLRLLFINLCEKYFMNGNTEGPLEHRERTNDDTQDGCAYVSTNTRYDAVWHTHTQKSTINAVYYAQIPDDSGTLSIIDMDGIHKKFIPLERYIYLMPGWMIHKPNPCKSVIPRVSFNMEFLSLERPVLKPDHWTEKKYGYMNSNTGAYILW